MLLLSAAAAGCDTGGDPADYCDAELGLGIARESAGTSLAPADGPTLVVSERGGATLWDCDDEDCRLIPLPEESELAGEDVLLAANGRVALGIAHRARAGAGVLYRFDFRRDENDHSYVAGGSSHPITWGGHSIDHLVATFRRDALYLARGVDGELLAINTDTWKFTPLTSGSDAELWQPIAMGDHSVLLRRRHGPDDDSVRVVDIDRHSADHLLMRGRDVTAGVFGADDREVYVSAGATDGELFSFDVADGAPTDRFRGTLAAARSGDAPIPGLGALAPGGRFLAYRTPGGSAAIRDLDEGASCLVRSSIVGDHQVVGFGATGHVFLESAARSPDGGTLREITIHDLADDAQATLRNRWRSIELGATLASVPTEYGSEEPWVVSRHEGAFFRLSPRADAARMSTGGDVFFVPRRVSGTWALRTAERRDGYRLEMLRYQHTRPSGDIVGHAPTWRAETEVCLSTGVPGSWAGRCGQAARASATFLSRRSTPDPGFPDSP